VLHAAGDEKLQAFDWVDSISPWEMPCLATLPLQALAAWLVDADGWQKAIASW